MVLGVICPNPECSDIRRTGNPGQYKPEIKVCPKCDTKLVPDGTSHPPVFDERTELQSPVPVMLINNTTLIPIVKSLRTVAGFRANHSDARPLDLRNNIDTTGYIRRRNRGRSHDHYC